MIFSAASFFTLQFGLSYYSIYEVEWLGWDLVEPWTYSFTQGSSIFGLWFLFRNRHNGVEYSELSDYLKEKRQKKWIKKENFDLQRHEFLKKRIEDLEVEIKSIEMARCL